MVTLTRRADFLAAARARRASVASFTLQARRRAPDEPVAGGDLPDRRDPEAMRVGYTCSKKVGNAVARNRAKRRLREAVRAVLPEHGKPGWDYVLIGRPGLTADRPFPLLLQDLRAALDRVHRPAAGRSGARSPAASPTPAA